MRAQRVVPQIMLAAMTAIHSIMKTQIRTLSLSRIARSPTCERAVEASENYYLLYYAPRRYAGDGKFKTIKVKVKGKGFRVVHRLGYFSN